MIAKYHTFALSLKVKLGTVYFVTKENFTG